jgi:hypothetical protein
MKPPKTLTKYDDSTLAGSKLIQLALEKILCCKPGIKIRWSVTINYWSDDWTDPEKTKDMTVIPTQGSFSNA